MWKNNRRSYIKSCLMETKTEWDRDTEQASEQDVSAIPFPRFDKPLLQKRSIDYDTWEFNYFPYLIMMRDIYGSILVGTYPEIREQVMSPSFFRSFNEMLYERSSKLVASNLRQMDEKEMDVYYEYLKNRDQEENGS